MIDYIVAGCVITGTFFMAVSAIGMLRLPDVYSRLHAVSKATTLGIAGVLIGSGLLFAQDGPLALCRGSDLAVHGIVQSSRSTHDRAQRLSDRRTADQ